MKFIAVIVVVFAFSLTWDAAQGCSCYCKCLDTACAQSQTQISPAEAPAAKSRTVARPAPTGPVSQTVPTPVCDCEPVCRSVCSSCRPVGQPPAEVA